MDVTNAEKLKEFMDINRIKPELLAEAAGISISTWYRKMQKDGDNFTVKEMNKIIDVTKMSPGEAAEIFFNEKLAETLMSEAERGIG